MQNTFSQSGNDSKWFLKKSFFKIGMWHSRPPRDRPPFMANVILNFHFDYWHPSLTHGPRMDVICYSEVCIFFCSGLVATLSRLVRVLSQYYIDRHCFTDISDFGFRNLGSEFRLDCLFLLWFTFTVGLPVHQGVSSLPKTCTQ